MTKQADALVWIDPPRSSDPEVPPAGWIFRPPGVMRMLASPFDQWNVRWHDSLNDQPRDYSPAKVRDMLQCLVDIAASDIKQGTIESVSDEVVHFYETFGPLGIMAWPVGREQNKPHEEWPENTESLEFVLQEAQRANFFYWLIRALLTADRDERRLRLQEVIGPIPEGFVVEVDRRPLTDRKRRTLRTLKLEVYSLASASQPLAPPREFFGRRPASASLVYDPEGRFYTVQFVPDFPADRRFSNWKGVGMTFRWRSPAYRKLFRAAQSDEGKGLVPAPLDEVESIAGDLIISEFASVINGVLPEGPSGPIVALFDYFCRCLLKNLPWCRCRYCGAEIENRRRNQRCCGPACSKAWHDWMRRWGRRRGGPALDLMSEVTRLFHPLRDALRVCRHCGSPIGQRRRKFCCDPCANAWRKADWRRRRGSVSLPDSRHATTSKEDGRYYRVGGFTVPRPREMTEYY